MLSNQVTIDFVLCSVVHLRLFVVVFFFKQKTAYELRISDWSSDVCSSDLTDAEKKEIRKDQADCMGCLSQCLFSSWADTDTNSTGRLADPRSFCIQTTLQDIAHGGPIENNLMFAGPAASNFKRDPFYSNRFGPHELGRAAWWEREGNGL